MTLLLGMRPVIALESMLGLDWPMIESYCSIKALPIDGLRPFVNVDDLTRRYCRLKSDCLVKRLPRSEMPSKLDFFIESVLYPHSRITTSPDIKLLRCHDGKMTEITLSRRALKSIIYDGIMTSFRGID